MARDNVVYLYQAMKKKGKALEDVERDVPDVEFRRYLPDGDREGEDMGGWQYTRILNYLNLPQDYVKNRVDNRELNFYSFLRPLLYVMGCLLLPVGLALITDSNMESLLIFEVVTIAIICYVAFHFGKDKKCQ